MTIVVTRTNATIIRTSGTKLVKAGTATQTIRRDTTKLVKAVVSTRVIRAAYGIPGPEGQGVPAGGTTGQVLAKASGDDYDMEWVAQSGGGGGGEANTASNLGAGQGIYKQKSSVDLQFRSLGVSGASTISLVGDVITFSVDGSLLTGIPQSGVTGLETALGLKANTADLGDAAYLDVGTGAGVVAAGNDARFTDQRTPLDGSVTDAKISGTLSQNKITNLETDLAGKVPVTRTVNGHALSANVTLTASDVGADASGTAAGAVSTHAALTDGVHGITAFSATLLDDVNAGSWRTTLGLGGAAVLNVGTASGTVAAGDHTHTSSAITDFASAVNAIISSSSIAITDTFVVASEAAMLALSSAEKGDIAVRTDTNTTYILSGTDPSDLGDWTLLRTPTDTVLSVNGLTGTVVLTTANVADSTDARYVTDAHLVILGNTSGTNTGDQTITLTGDVTGSGTGSFAATIANDAVTNAKMANMATGTLKGRSTSGTGDPEDLSASAVRTLLSLVPGTDVQAYDATLAAWAAFNSNGMLVQTAADTFTARTLTGTTNEIDITDGNGVAGNPTFALAATVDLTGKTLNVRDSTFSIKDNSDPTKILQFQLSAISAGTTRTLTAPDASGTILVDGNIGVTIQGYDAELAAIAGLVSAADRLPYFTGSGTASLATFTAAGRALVDDANSTDQRATLGLGTMATQNSSSVSITGGTISSITDLSVGDGGTGASDATNARANLGLIIGTDVQPYSARLAFSTVLSSSQSASFTAVANASPYPVNLSGASGHFEVTFPGSPAAGDRFAIFVSVAHASHTYCVKPVVSGAPSIRGTTGHDNKWSLWEVGERLDFIYDGATWQVEKDGRIAHSCGLNRNTAQSSVGPSATKILLNNALTNTAGIGDVATNNRIDIKRDGKYVIECGGAIAALNSGERGDFLVYINGTGGTLALFARGHSSIASGAIGVGQGKERSLVAGDYVELYQGTSSASSSTTITSNEASMPTLCVQEVL